MLPDASTNDKGSVQLATSADVLLAESQSLALTPASIRLLQARILWPSRRSKKNEVPFNGTVNGYKSRGTLSSAFTFSDYATTEDGTHLLLVKSWNNTSLRVLRWDGAYFSELQNINDAARYSQFRVMNCDGVTVLYDGNKAYTWKAGSRRFEETGLVRGLTFSHQDYAQYAVAYDGVFRVAVADRLNNSYLFTLDDPYQPHVLTPVGELPFATTTAALASSGARRRRGVWPYRTTVALASPDSSYRVLHLDGNPTFGLLATTINVDSAQIRHYRVQPGTSTIEAQTINAQTPLPDGGLYTAGQLVYQDSARVIIANGGNELAGKVHSLDGDTVTELGSYDQLYNGGDIKLFNIGTRLCMMIQEGPGASEQIGIYQLDGASKTRLASIPGQITTAAKSLGLAVFDHRVLVINGNERNVFELIIE